MNKHADLKQCSADIQKAFGELQKVRHEIVRDAASSQSRAPTGTSRMSQDIQASMFALQEAQVSHIIYSAQALQEVSYMLGFLNHGSCLAKSLASETEKIHVPGNRGWAPSSSKDFQQKTAAEASALYSFTSHQSSRHSAAIFVDVKI